MSAAETPPALVSTLHDPAGRLLAALRRQAATLDAYAGAYVRVTDATDVRVSDLLGGAGAAVVRGQHDQIGLARRLALQDAFDAEHASFLYCDLDRWLHWAERFPAELAGLPRRLSARRPRLWYACLGRTARAFASHPAVQRATERQTNHAVSLALHRRLDVTAGACWLSRPGAGLILSCSQEPTNATDAEWPALVYRTAPRRLGYAATEGLEFETADFYPAEIARAGALARWLRDTYDRPEVWQARLRLAADSVRAANEALRRPVPLSARFLY